MPRSHPWTPPARCRLRAADLSVIEIRRTDMPQLSTSTRGSRRLEPPATSAVVARLAHAGLVNRAPDPHDHRRVPLTVTAQHIVGDTGPRRHRSPAGRIQGHQPADPPSFNRPSYRHRTGAIQRAQASSLIYIDYARTKGCVETAGSAEKHESADSSGCDGHPHRQPTAVRQVA
jgi:hypothetical protein